MRPSPRERRLIADYQSLVRLQNESTIFSFRQEGRTPELYDVHFRGLGLWQLSDGQVVPRDGHHVRIELGSAYPRMIPAMSWRTPIFHPNISQNGIVCLGGYTTHWVPSLKLDELCVMLWDMIRYKNFDVQSPYNREAALWARDQVTIEFPLDGRCLRDRISGDAAPEVPVADVCEPNTPPIVYQATGAARRAAGPSPRARQSATADIVFIN